MYCISFPQILSWFIKLLKFIFFSAQIVLEPLNLKSWG